MEGQELAIPQIGDFGASIGVLGGFQGVDDGAVGVCVVGCDFSSYIVHIFYIGLIEVNNGGYE